MVEAHGWITLRYSDYHSEDDKQNDFLFNFKQFINQQYAWLLDGQAGQVGRLVNRNGLYCFALDVLHNHADAPFYPIAIFNWVAQHSTGSYGLLYIHDDEDKANENEFQVFVLKRGRLLVAKDTFLSPFEEEVEKQYDPNDPPKD